MQATPVPPPFCPHPGLSSLEHTTGKNEREPFQENKHLSSQRWGWHQGLLLSSQIDAPEARQQRMRDHRDGSQALPGPFQASAMGEQGQGRCSRQAAAFLEGSPLRQGCLGGRPEALGK